MNTTKSSISQILRIASELEASNPLLAYELERHVLAVINPGARKLEHEVDAMVGVLKSIRQELDKLNTDAKLADPKKFAEYFEEMVSAEQEELNRLLRSTGWKKTAGISDYVKGLFKDKKKDDKKDEERPASYDLGDEAIDDIVEGKAGWSSPEHYVEQEFRENSDFFKGVGYAIKELSEIKKNPSRPFIESLIKRVNKLVTHGENIAKGIRKHIKDAPKIEMKEEGIKPKDAPSQRKAPKDISGVVDHYADMLKESAGDEKKLLKYLKELFDVIGPAIQDERATLASSKLLPVFIRTASVSPGARKVLLPVIKRWTGR